MRRVNRRESFKPSPTSVGLQAIARWPPLHAGNTTATILTSVPSAPRCTPATPPRRDAQWPPLHASNTTATDCDQCPVAPDARRQHHRDVMPSGPRCTTATPPRHIKPNKTSHTAQWPPLLAGNTTATDFEQCPVAPAARRQHHCDDRLGGSSRVLTLECTSITTA